jgi:biotin carboxylase
VIEDCKEQLKRCVKAANLDTCAVNIDFMLCRGKVYVLELGARCGATMLAETVSLYYGFNYYEQMIKAHLGEDSDFSRKSSGCASATMTLYSNHYGVIISQENLNPPNEHLVEVHFDKKIGDSVLAFRNGAHRLGHVIVKGETRKEAENYLKEALKNIKINVG